MNAHGWKTVVVQNHSSLGYRNGSLVIEGEDKYEVPITQIKVLVIESLQISLTAYLLNELNRNGVKVVLCDEKHLPSAELVSYHDNYRQTENIFTQFNWNPEVCDKAWKQIIEQKICMQIDLLRFEGLDVPEELIFYSHCVEVGDTTNREGQAARVYFRTLFGMNFNRNAPTELNACLNYGYSLLLANISRKIVAMGYMTNLGIHHVSVENPYNLACDLMEPFRSYVDRLVYENRISTLSNMKRLMIESLYNEVKYNQKQMQFHVLLDTYVEDVIHGIKRGEVIDYQMEYF